MSEYINKNIGVFVGGLSVPQRLKFHNQNNIRKTNTNNFTYIYIVI